MKKILLIFFAFLTVGSAVFGQSTDTTTYNRKDDFSISGFPIVFYLPETSFSFGVVGLTVFNIGKTKAWRKSQVSLGSAYSLKNQLLNFVPYELYFKQHWKLNGELGYYRYFYNYYGIGIDAKASDLESFDANFPRVLSTLSYRVTPSFLVGVQYRFDAFDMPRTDSLLNADAPVGLNGGVVSTFGLSSSYDTRDDIFYPRKGIFATFTAETSGNFSFADFEYSMIQLDVMGYYTLKQKHTIAANFYTGTIVGEAPFFSYFYLSSGKRGRGYNDRRFIDKNIGLAQVEYRFPIYKRFRGAAFTSLGTVGANYSDLFSNRKIWSYGAGLRFQMSKKQMSHLRVDVAHGAEGFQFYVTIGEAF
jgi:outer membrane protein assembly factor BamA